MKDILIKIFALLTLLFVYVISSRTPLMWEDVVYTLKADASLGAAMSNSAVADTIQLGRYERVESIPDLLESSYYHYMNANGRLFPHMTSQAFGALIGKPVFNVLNAFVFFLMITMVTLLIVDHRKRFWKWWVVVLSGLWLLMPETNTCFFLMTYALNYLWSSAICASFLYLYSYISYHRVSPWLGGIGCVFAFGAGWSHEGMAVGIAAGLFFDQCFDIYSHRLNTQKLIWAICFVAGAFLLCIAPGNFNRTDAALPLYNHLLSFARLRIFWMFLLAWVVFSRSTDFIKQNRLLLVALAFQSLFLFYVGYRNGRVLWGTELFSFILLLKVFADKERNGYFLTYLSYTCLLLLVVHFSWLVYRSGEVRKQYDEVIEKYLASEDGAVYYDLYLETEIVRRFIPAPLCNNRQFELRTYSLYYTREQKLLDIKPCSEKTTDINGSKK